MCMRRGRTRRLLNAITVTFIIIFINSNYEKCSVERIDGKILTALAMNVYKKVRKESFSLHVGLMMLD